MRRNLLICVLLAAMLVEASCFSEECWNRIERFWDYVIFGPRERDCTLPYPPNGGRIVGGYPGQSVPHTTRLTYSCTDGYIMRGSEISICSDGVWHNTPTCLHSENIEPPQDVPYYLINPRFRDD